MLGRAVSKYQAPPPTKRENVATAFAASSSPTATQITIDETLKSFRQQPSQKSIGGYTNYMNRQNVAYTSNSMSTFQGKPTITARSTNFLKRTSSEMSGIAATLSKAGSFQNNADTVDLTQDDSTSSRTVSGGSVSASNTVLDFDPNDFDDDSELDLDVEYPQALPPQSVHRGPLDQISSNVSQNTKADPSLKTTTTRAYAVPSSAQTWSSSPPAHKATPPGALLRRQAENAVSTSAPMSSEASIDANPRPAKRRTMPWLQKKAEEEERQREEAESDPGLDTTMCFICGKSGHIRTECTNTATTTPLAKGKSQPFWNTTASALKEQQKAFKTQQKKLVKENSVSAEIMREAIITSSKAKAAPIFLSQEQKNVLELVTVKNKSVFFTGSAGTGKSVLMRAIIADLRKKYVREPDRVAVTASTGLAACNIGGVTLHSFGGIGLGKEEVPELVKKINRNQKAKNRWIRTKVLVIDEISMVDGALFDKLEGIARIIRKNGRPFGGIQLVITGDFFQLPPVPDYGKKDVKFAFDAGTWSTTINHTIGLTEVFRQRDPVFANMLNEMRLGQISDETVKAFRRLDRPIKHEDALEATELFPTRNEVENANAFKMRNLQGTSFTFNAIDGGTIKDINQRDKLLSNCMAPPTLQLKKGAQVMLIKNIDENLVNGSLGKVIAFMNEATFEMYDDDPDSLVKGRIDDEDTENAFSEARRNLKSKISKDLVGDTSREFPLVRFAIPDGTSRDLLCQPEDWKVELPNGEIQAQRRQLPLILAWALSIHKAQGQTLERVKVDLRKVFENGQAYVALSRATCQEGLQVSGFDKRKVMAHPKVGEFYNSLYSVNKALKNPKVAQPPVTKKAKDHEQEFLEGTGQGYDCNDDEEALAAAYG